MSCRHHIIVVLVLKCRTPKINQLDCTRFWKVLEERTVLGWSYKNLHCKSKGVQKKICIHAQKKLSYHLSTIPSTLESDELLILQFHNPSYSLSVAQVDPKWHWHIRNHRRNSIAKIFFLKKNHKSITDKCHKET